MRRSLAGTQWRCSGKQASEDGIRAAEQREVVGLAVGGGGGGV